MSPDPYKRNVPYVNSLRGYEQQLELELNKTRDATPEEVRQWEQEDFFRAGNFDAMKLFVVFPTIIQLLALAFMFSIFLFNDQVF
tara:strand:- start:236 stop:490 length:255 start_codon:yes stop_codon:yes gene_type:complete